MTAIDVWADVRCPWCWIGLHRLQKAVTQVQREVQVRHRAFLLEPEGPSDPGRPIAEIAVEAWGMSREQWAASSTRIRDAGAGEGLVINIDTAVAFDSRPVHRLLKASTAHVATERAKGAAGWESAFQVHFGVNQDLSVPASLEQFGASLGLSLAAVHDVLAGDAFAAEVEHDVREASKVQVHAVPTVVAGGRSLSGSRTVSELVDLIQRDGVPA